MDKDLIYLKAVKAGDITTCQKMVGEKAKETGYEYGPVWHSGPEAFNMFKRRFERDGFSSSLEAKRINRFGKGIFFTSSKEVANKFGKVTKSYYLKINNAIEVNHGGVNYFDGTMHDPITGEEYLDDNGNPIKSDQSLLPDEMADEHLDDLGEYDTGIILRGMYESIPSKGNPKPMSDIYVVGNPNQIKSADPVTYDNQGNVIPLSKRFNTSSNDIRENIFYRLYKDILIETGI
jgi:hypothetical protein